MIAKSILNKQLRTSCTIIFWQKFSKIMAPQWYMYVLIAMCPWCAVVYGKWIYSELPFLVYGHCLPQNLWTLDSCVLSMYLCTHTTCTCASCTHDVCVELPSRFLPLPPSLSLTSSSPPPLSFSLSLPLPLSMYGHRHSSVLLKGILHTVESESGMVMCVHCTT